VIEKRLDAAKEAALRAGKLLLAGRPGKIRTKGLHDIASDMDAASEKLITAYLAEQFPEDNFYGEEGGRSGTNGSGGLWIIDPIDGTDNYVRGIPGYTVSIAWRNPAGALEIGVVYSVRQDDLFWAASGGGAFCNGEPIHVSEYDDPALAMTIACPHPRIHDERAGQFFDIMRRLFLQSWDFRNFGSAALEMCYVASGRADALIQFGLQIYDIAAGMVILSEAGGRCTSMFPGEDVQKTGNVLATNGLLHEWFQAFLQK
jgi:myo-inositol-1(or 4)-monophosphatase